MRHGSGTVVRTCPPRLSGQRRPSGRSGKSEAAILKACRHPPVRLPAERKDGEPTATDCKAKGLPGPDARFRGRRKEMIKTGGIKVTPLEIELILR